MKEFPSFKTAYEYATTLGKNDSEIAKINGKLSFITSTNMPVEERLRNPIEECVKDFLAEVGYSGTKEDVANIIGAEICEEIIRKLAKRANVIVYSAQLPY